MSHDNGTLTQVLLQAARSLPQPFTREQLVVCAWKLRPDLFGLAGFELPCSHRVSSCLYGRTGPLQRGLIERTGEGFQVAREDGE